MKNKYNHKKYYQIIIIKIHNSDHILLKEQWINFNYLNNQFNSVSKIKVNKCLKEENHCQVEINKNYKKFIQINLWSN